MTVQSDDLLFFEEQDPKKLSRAGGKGARLVELFLRKYRVPRGFVILPSAFDHKSGKLHDHSWKQIITALEALRGNSSRAFAVRSSALAEDSYEASFAGEFETVLNVRSNEEILNAIYTVYESRKSKRVVAYSQAKQLDFRHEMAVIVQLMVDSTLSGVLFTADPVTGDDMVMVGNYIHGLGDKLVSGEVNAEEFKLKYPRGAYEGPSELNKFAKALFQLGKRLADDYGYPQDIEWAIYNDKLYLLQTRPITTLSAGNELEWDINSTNTGDFLWTHKMSADQFPYPLKPSTWSMWKPFLLRQSISRSGVDLPAFGLIGGMIYINASLTYSMMSKVLRSEEKCNDYFESIFNEYPDPKDINPFPIPLRKFLVQVLIPEIKAEFRKRKLKKNHIQFFEQIYTKCQDWLESIPSMTPHELKQLNSELSALFMDNLHLQDGTNELFFKINNAFKKILSKFLEKEQSDELIAHFSGVAENLESIGPLVGVDRLISGEITRDEFIAKYGHRSPYENYLSYPRPYEDQEWVTKQIQQYQQSKLNIRHRLKDSSRKFEELWHKIAEGIPPKEAKKIRSMIVKLQDITDLREQTRSHVTRLIGIYRSMYLRAGRLLDIGDDIFFLTVDEMFSAITGETQALEYIPMRKLNFERYRELPRLPEWIRGRFDPFRWAEDPNRSTELVPLKGMAVQQDKDAEINGFPGSAGVVEGTVRVIFSPEESDSIIRGEIMVTTTTNVGWTPIFPQLSGVVTDSGATLSHAAIVARELGIPAVVGCRNATQRLKTGDRVRIDGSKGTVTLLEKE